MRFHEIVKRFAFLLPCAALALGSVVPLASPAAAGEGTVMQSLELTPKAARRAAKTQRKREKKQRARAERYLEQNPEAAAAYEPAPGVDPTESTPVDFDGGSGTVLLGPLDSGLLDLGARLERGWKRDNLISLYERLYQIVPAQFLQDLRPPSELAGLSTGRVAREFRLMAERIDRDWTDIRLIITSTLPGLLDPNFIGDCTAELGWEAGGNEVSDRCAAADYAADGILANLDFVLKDDLTCVRDQGARGTCVSHGLSAALESQVLVNGGNPKTLSEQYSYFIGKILSDWATRYDDGLTTSAVLEAFDDFDVRTPLEKSWNYNLSLSRDPFDASTNQYPDSCTGYTGEECTDYSFQSEEIVTPIPGGGTLYEYPYPSFPAGQGNVVTGYTTIPDLRDINPADVLDLVMALLMVEAEKPVMASIQVPPAFRSPDANGYVQYVAGEQASGNHLVEVVGFIGEADLPAGAPSDPDGVGFFVIKNSWGIDYGDCGFSYLSYEFMRNWRNSFWYLDDDVD